MNSAGSLLISEQFDQNAQVIDWALRSIGAKSTWLRSGSLFDSALPAMAWSVGAGRGVEGLNAVASDRWSSVLFRLDQEPPSDPSDTKERAFIKQEWRVLQRNVWAIAPQAIDALWVNAPVASLRAENKLVQLEEVRHCGLAVPATLVGNDSEMIFAFLAEQPNAIYKPFIPHTWASEGKRFQTPATRMPNADQLNPRTLELCPGIYQAMIEKRADWRVTIIGKRMFAIRISAHADPKEIDWRPNLLVDGNTRCAPRELPSLIETQLFDLMKRLGLAYGAADLVEDLDGNFWFLEINQVGQFLWVERLFPELPLLKSMCAMMISGSEIYDPDICKSVSFDKYLKAQSAQTNQHFQAA
jgi:glutathione synthase/RimK-type ligase-like ATP-grasp enzyme